VFSEQALALRTHQQHTLQSFKNTFTNRNLDQNILKNALFFEKTEKSPQGWGLRPQPLLAFGGDPGVITLITCYTYVFKGFCSANVISVKKERQ